MSRIYIHDCPHCRTKNSGFAVCAGTPNGVAGGAHEHNKKAWLLICLNPACRGPAIVETMPKKGEERRVELLDPRDETFFAPTADRQLPEHLPARVERA